MVAIDDEGFQDRYFERSPLNRCVLANDLEQILDRHPQRVGIDLDLSPLNGATEEETACQQRLDRLLDAHPATLVLLSPFAVRSTALRALKLQWMEDRCKDGLHFGDGRLETSLGMVIDQRDPAGSGLADVTANGHDNSICDLVLRDRTVAATTLLSPAGSAANADLERADARRRPINFEAAARLVPSSLTVHSDLFRSLAELRGHVVFFGGQWGSDDTFDTPIGEQPGVWIHAARFVTLTHPVRETSRVWGVLVDVGIAFMFSLLIKSFWELYFDLKIMESERVQDPRENPTPRNQLNQWASTLAQGIRQHSAWSTAMVITFVSAYLMLSVTFFLIGRYLFVAHGLLIAPLLIAISMLADGFVTGPVDVIAERERSREYRRHASASTIRRCLTAVILVASYFALLIGLMLTTSEAGLVMLWIYGGLAFIASALLVSGVYLLRTAALPEDRHVMASSAHQPWRIAHPLFNAFGSALSIVRFIGFWGVLSYALLIVGTS
ncbi:MAG: CHASE2 domain-containing protein [Gemmatimonadaceae bacterium]